MAHVEHAWPCDRHGRAPGRSRELSSRVAHHIDFPDFSVIEFEEIGHLMVGTEGYTFAPETEKVFADYVRRRKEQPRFANARSIRNAIEGKGEASTREPRA